jgi:mannose-1-phosphate guanylyltransferase
LSCAYLHFEKHVPKSEPIIVLPIDAFAEDSYFSGIQKMADTIAQDTQNYDLLLLGALPTYPSEKYGYIVPETYQQDSVMRVASFKEKPSLDYAEQLLAQGAYWNCGVFAFRLEYMLKKLDYEYTSDSYLKIAEHYHDLPCESFDYAVVEKASSMGMIEYRGLWKDLGTWNTLTEEMKQSVVGQSVYIADTCENIHVLNMLDTPIIVMGLSNSVVVASHDGILVSDKQQSSYIKPYADKIKQRPMYEQRSWGDYRVLDYGLDNDGNSTLTKKMHIRAGEQISYQYHKKRMELWSITKGEGVVYQDDVKRKVFRNDILSIPPLSKHGIAAITDLEFIEVQLGESALDEDDIFRITEHW